MALIAGESWSGNFSALTVTYRSRSTTQKDSGRAGGGGVTQAVAAQVNKDVTLISSSFGPYLPALASLFGGEDV